MAACSYGCPAICLGSGPMPGGGSSASGTVTPKDGTVWNPGRLLLGAGRPERSAIGTEQEHGIRSRLPALVRQGLRDPQDQLKHAPRSVSSKTRSDQQETNSRGPPTPSTERPLISQLSTARGCREPPQ